MAIGVIDAARNNAAWCDAVCCAHGGHGEFFDSHWLTRAPAPPYYPNLVTLAPPLAPAMAGVRALDQTGLLESWAVKDSFAVLPLGEAGFRLLFEAEWIVRPADSAQPRPRSLGTRWFRVQTESELSAWERAWGGSLGQPRIFLPALLYRSDIAILAALGEGGVITAGVVANRAENAVGLSNFFVHVSGRASLRAECIEATVDTFPGLPLVGYEAGQDLEESYALGFSSLGSLRVWVKETLRERPRPKRRVVR